MSSLHENRNAVDSPLVSVVIPCYDLGRYLREAIASVEQCDGPIYEIIVIDDGSTEPDTRKVLDALELEGYHVIQQANKGLATARNVGIAAARGRYILPLDADNKIRPDYISKSVEILNANPGIDVVYGKPNIFGDVQSRQSYEITYFDLARMLTANYIDACAIYRKSMWERIGGYDLHMPVQGYEDWDLWLSAAAIGAKFCFVNEILFDYRIRQDSMLSNTHRPENHATTYGYIVRKHLRLFQEEYQRQSQESDLQKEAGKWLTDLMGAATYGLTAKAAEDVVRQFFAGLHPRTWRDKRLEGQILSSKHMVEVFEGYASGDASRVDQHLASAIRYDPIWLRNIGVLSILMRALSRQIRMRWAMDREKPLG